MKIDQYTLGEVDGDLVIAVRKSDDEYKYSGYFFTLDEFIDMVNEEMAEKNKTIEKLLVKNAKLKSQTNDNLKRELRELCDFIEADIKNQIPFISRIRKYMQTKNIWKTTEDCIRAEDFWESEEIK